MVVVMMMMMLMEVDMYHAATIFIFYLRFMYDLQHGYKSRFL